MLQSESSLQRVPYCELSGYANTNEAYHQTASIPSEAPKVCPIKAFTELNGGTCSPKILRNAIPSDASLPGRIADPPCIIQFFRLWGKRLVAPLFRNEFSKTNEPLSF